MSCTTQPVFQVRVDNQMTYLCGKCMAELSKNSEVEIHSENHVVGETCQCNECNN